MTTPTPLDRRVEDHRAQMHDLAAALKQPATGYVRLVILDAMLGVFERTAALVAPPRGISDTSGDHPDVVMEQMFTEPTQAELLTLPRTEPNGFDHRAV